MATRERRVVLEDPLVARARADKRQREASVIEQLAAAAHNVVFEFDLEYPHSDRLLRAARRFHKEARRYRKSMR